MKKAIAMLLMATMVFTLFGCGAKPAESATETQETVKENVKVQDSGNADETAQEEIKVAFIVQDLANASMAYSYNIMQQKASEFGYTMTAFDEGNDPQKGVDAIGTCIAQKYDAIIIIPSDPSAVAASLMEAKEAGIVIGLFTSDLAPENQQFRDFFVGVNDTQAGETAAKALIEAFPDGCNVVEIGGQSGHDAQIKRTDGFAKGLEGSNIQMLASQNCEAWATEDAMSIMEDYITKYGDEIDAVFCHWDIGATGVINALTNAGITDVYVIGIDGCSAGYDQVKAGTQAVCIGQSFSNMVQRSFECIQAALNGQQFEELNWIPLDIVTLDNIDELPYPEW